MLFVHLYPFACVFLVFSAHTSVHPVTVTVTVTTLSLLAAQYYDDTALWDTFY